MGWSAGSGWDERLARLKVAEGAMRQASRHERALRACLAELVGHGAPTDPMQSAMLARARRHADRAYGLAGVAIRLNRDPLAAPALAAALERLERDLMGLRGWGTDGSAPAADASVADASVADAA